jgi:hypothetical protein
MLATFAVSAAEDPIGSTDPLGLERFAHSWIIGYARDDADLPREFIISPVEKIRRELRIKEKISINGSIENATYEMPPGTSRQQVIDHYKKVAGANVLFSCSGRDCGRSNGWANQVFQIALLYGPDANQFYQASDIGEALVGVYVIERGNRRIHAHVQVLHPDTPVNTVVNSRLTEQLAGDGYAIIDGLEFAGYELTAASLDQLEELAPRLRIFERQTVYVVCHTYGPGEPATLIDAATQCAQSASDRLRLPNGPKLVPFGAGPLVPRSQNGRSRVELVLPHRQQRD